MDNYESVKKRALRILGDRNYSRQEMRKRLISKGESTEAAEAVVEWLTELGYINDSDYATLIVRHYSGKGYGEVRIRDELYKRGIPRDLWDEKLSLVNQEETEDSTLEFLRKKLRGSTDKNDMRRATDALVRRGFSFEDSRAAMSRYLEDIGDDIS